MLLLLLLRERTIVCLGCMCDKIPREESPGGFAIIKPIEDDLGLRQEHFHVFVHSGDATNSKIIH